MKEGRPEQPALQEQSPWSVLEELARKGAREMLGSAMGLEVREFVEKHKDKRVFRLPCGSSCEV
jgi:hypothetical protein